MICTPKSHLNTLYILSNSMKKLKVCLLDISRSVHRNIFLSQTLKFEEIQKNIRFYRRWLPSDISNELIRNTYQI